MPATALPVPDSAAVPTERGRLTFVETGRGLAALAVVVFHANASAPQFGGPTWRWPSAGEHGVDFFFVLSGFIILTAHRGDIGRPGAGRPYLLKRAFRLLPLLWAVVLGWAMLRWCVGQPDSPLLVLRSALLWPSLAPTAPLVVWTLRHELLFYAAFAVLVARPRWGVALFAAWGAAALGQAVLVGLGRPVTGPASLLLSTYTLDFLIGAGVAWLHRLGRLPRGRWVLPASLVGLAAALAVEEWAGISRMSLSDYVSPGAVFWPPLLGLVFAGVLVGLLAAETRRTAPRWAVGLGAASYALYLVHTPVNAIVQHLAVWLPAPVLAVGGGHALLVVAGIGAGVAMHRGFERPVTQALRRRWLGPRTRGETGGMASLTPSG